jgi:hypothetical protein
MEIHEQHLRQVMDHVVQMQDQAHQLMVDTAELAGFSRKRVRDLTVGDEIGFGSNEWKLVTDVESSCTPEGFEVWILQLDDDPEPLPWSFGADDIVDVKAAPIREPF